MNPITSYISKVSSLDQKWKTSIKFHTYYPEESSCRICVKTEHINHMQIFRGISLTECKSNLGRAFVDAMVEENNLK